MCSAVRKLLVQRTKELIYCLEQIGTNGELLNSVDSAVQSMVLALKNGNHIYFFGNGGSAADAQHLTAEFVGRFMLERAALPATALTVNTSILTALGNDYDYSVVFSRQVEAYVRAGDICIGLSTSGNSLNVLAGMETAKAKGAKTIGITGQYGNKMKQVADICICLPSNDTPRIQEMTIFVGHIICEYVECLLYGN